MEFRVPRFFGLHAEPTSAMFRFLPLLPFVVLIAGYLIASHLRLRENPEDRFMPSVTQMAETVGTLAFTPDKNTGRYLMLEDTLASLRRVCLGVGLAGLFGLILGINLGLFPGMQAIFDASLAFFSIIPSLLLLPILFIFFGVFEFSKIAIIFIGTAPAIGRGIDLAVRRMISREQVVKSLTLGASQLQVVYFVVLPQIVPYWIDTMRVAFGAAWLFLIAAEMVAATEGLGYRTFLMRRYLAMDGIIPYVLWVTLISIAIDRLLGKFVAWQFPWYRATKQD
ncbi:ABC transporter permease subunit [Candidatus Parcubacteria bacterium]|nr:ABC transporter permease subunit [Candidatus Parcubacteria bacterium]